MINSNSKVASGIFTKDFMIVNSANEVQIIACTIYTKFVTPSVSDLYRVKRNYVFLVFQTVYEDIFFKYEAITIILHLYLSSKFNRLNCN